MGIVNVTPDSFWDGGRYFDTAAAVAHGVQLAEEGADFIDVGGESTRPHAQPVPEEEELRRVLPVLERLQSRVSVPISIDTRKPRVAKAALELGVSLVNDIGASEQTSDMWRLVAESGAAYVCMHMQGTPETMQSHPVYADVVEEIQRFFSLRLQQLRDCGIGPDQIILDPGIGFGKSLEHNLELLGGLRRFTCLERPLLLGVSRKSFMGKLLGTEAQARLPAALACACIARADGVQMIRTHDVAETVQALRMAEAILARQRYDVGNDK